MTLGQGAIALACTPAAEPTDYSGEIQCQTHTGDLSKPTGTERKQKMGIWERAAENSSGRRRGMGGLCKNNQNVLYTCMKLPKTNLINNKTCHLNDSPCSHGKVTSMTAHAHRGVTSMKAQNHTDHSNPRDKPHTQKIALVLTNRDSLLYKYDAADEH